MTEYPTLCSPSSCDYFQTSNEITSSMKMLHLMLLTACLSALGTVCHAQTDQSVNKKGLTLQSSAQGSSSTSRIFSAACKSENSPEFQCNPIEGDTFCHYAKPVLCFRDIDAPVPETLAKSRYWTGGILALTDPKRGDSFSQLHDANAYCAMVFGQGWRVASYHDGGGEKLKGYGATPEKGKRFWIDIKDQSQGTCWAR